MKVSIGSLVFALGLIGFLAYLVSPVDMFFEWKPLSYGETLGSFGNCEIKKIPTNCWTDKVCQETCRFSLLGVCLLKDYTNCQFVQKCDYTTKIVCSNPTSYNPSPPSSIPQCPEGQVWINGACRNPYGTYSYSGTTTSGSGTTTSGTSFSGTSSGTTTVNTLNQPIVYRTTRLTCSGDIIQNKYIRGQRYVSEQLIETTCQNGVCQDKVISEKVKEDCVNKPYPNVCREDGGNPRCVMYPLELKIETLLDKLRTIIH